MVIKTRFNVGEEVSYGSYKDPFKVFSIEIQVSNNYKGIIYLVQSKIGFILRVKELDLIKMQIKTNKK